MGSTESASQREGVGLESRICLRHVSALLCPAVYKSVLPARNAILCLYSNVFVPQRLGCKGILYKSYLQAQDPTGSYVAESINDFSTEFDFLVF